MNSKLEDVLRGSVGREVRVCFETSNGDGFTINGDLLEVTDEYIRMRGLANCSIYINRKSTVITYFEVFERERKKFDDVF